MTEEPGHHQKFRRLGVALVAVQALAVLGAACGSPGTASNRSTTTTGATKTSPTKPTTAGPRTVLSQRGTADVDTRIFSVPSSANGWDLAWSFSCTTKPPSIFSFVVVIFQGPWRDEHDKAVTQSSAGAQGTEHNSDSGSFSLHISSYPRLCSWTVRATSS